MPVIKPYTAPGVTVDTAQQRATGASFGAPIGAGLSAVGKGIDYVKTQVEEDESRQAIVGASQIRADYARKLDEAQISGADTAPLKQQMMDDLAKVGENFATSRGQSSLALHTAQSELAFDEQANRIAVAKASNEARLQGEQFLQNESRKLRSAPESLAISERNAEDLVNTFSGLSPQKRALVLQDITTQLNMAAVNASARIDPPGTKARLEAGEWKLTPKEREQGIAETDTQMRAIRSDELHRRQLADYDEKKRWADESNDLLTKIYKGTLANGEIANSPLPREIRENLSHFQAFLAEDKTTRKHPSAMLELWLDVNANSDDPRKIYNNDKIFNYAFDHRISAPEAQEASGWVANQKDENNRSIGSKLSLAMNEVGRAVAADLTVNWSPQNVAAIQMDYQARVMEKVADLRKENKNPNVVFDPKSQHYIGSPEFISQSIRTIKMQMRNEGVNSSIKAGERVQRDGKTWEFTGGDPKLPGSWRDMGAATSGATTGF